MTTYYRLAKIEDSAEFINAAISLGWDAGNYQEILEDIGNEDGYIVNYDDVIDTKTDPLIRRAAMTEVEVLFTIGGGSGNRWFSAGDVDAIVFDDGRVYAKERVIDEICC